MPEDEGRRVAVPLCGAWQWRDGRVLRYRLYPAYVRYLLSLFQNRGVSHRELAAVAYCVWPRQLPGEVRQGTDEKTRFYYYAAKFDKKLSF